MNDNFIVDEAVLQRVRRRILDAAFHAGTVGAHLGSSLSLVEIVSVLFGHTMKYDKSDLTSSGRDRFILSKGHGALGYYAVLAESGIIAQEQFAQFESNGGPLPAQPVMNSQWGIECASGSLGLGLSFGAGIALALKKKQSPFRVYVLLGDGECNEGTVWEAAISCAHFKLNNITAIVDYNKMQSDGFSQNVMSMGAMSDKWASFGFEVYQVDGHNVTELEQAFDAISASQSEKPSVIIAHTTKGKGVSFMENNPEWHHNRLSEKDYNAAVAEINGGNE